MFQILANLLISPGLQTEDIDLTSDRGTETKLPRQKRERPDTKMLQIQRENIFKETGEECQAGRQNTQEKSKNRRGKKICRLQLIKHLPPE